MSTRDSCAADRHRRRQSSDQFAYTAKLHEGDDTVTLNSNGSSGSLSAADVKPVEFPLVIASEEQLMALSRMLLARMKAVEVVDAKAASSKIAPIVAAAVVDAAPTTDAAAAAAVEPMQSEPTAEATPAAAASMSIERRRPLSDARRWLSTPDLGKK